jgi:hypothetical protein
MPHSSRFTHHVSFFILHSSFFILHSSWFIPNVSCFMFHVSCMVQSFDFGQQQGSCLDESTAGVARFPAVQTPWPSVVWLAPAKAKHLALGEKRIGGCSGRKLAEVVLAIMLRRKAFHLNLPAALGKHVAGGRGQSGRLLTNARSRVPFQHPQRLLRLIDNRHDLLLLDCVVGW